MNYRWIVKTAAMHLNLNLEELKSLMPNAKITTITDVLFDVQTTILEIDNLLKYAATVRKVLTNIREICTKELHENNYDFDIFTKHENDLEIDFSDNMTTAVRFYQIGSKDKSLKSYVVEGKIAKLLFSQPKKMKVDLKNPQKPYLMFNFKDVCYCGWEYGRIEFMETQSRAPKNSPFFGGGALKPHFGRLMINLVYPFPAVMLDPFSGHGGLLREIANMGMTAIGFEISYKLILECQANNHFHGYQDTVLLICCDALYPPIRSNAIEKAISDPPYALQTTTRGRKPQSLVLSWLDQQVTGMIIVFSIPTEMLNKVPNDWEILLDRTDYVHRSLTRQVRKLIKL